ncbi:c25903fc-f912-4c5b-8a13-5aeab7c5710d-CDS [Sclerotinia trifoliorum]|uniref:C25903fc-f912-4c5b-8a13-5aeab7c5710d-CDS n=1 Tax=Sclerotinia trifoliorum TaxID=28548 RepID=A0A8H2W4M5_9HELO|nr:c25903fc-f912-4c5b-8a13-5aeab7c5710d-CDS [Sclerotinia trifoliorum]
MNGPMENPIDALILTNEISQSHVDKTLKATEGVSPPMVAHPGSTVDISGRRPSLVTAMASTHVDNDEKGFSFGSSRSHKIIKSWGITEEGRNMSRGVGGDDVAAKLGSYLNEKENDHAKMMQVAGLPFYIPAKVPEEHERRKSSEMTVTDTEVDADFDFEEVNGTWISAHSSAHASTTSLATTDSSASTIMDDRSHDDTFAADTSIACSSGSSIYSSSAASISSCTTGTSTTDIYGWEEELERKSSEGSPSWDHRSELGAAMRRLPSGGRTIGTRGGHTGGLSQFSYKRADGKKKSLLYRVLNISPPKRLNDDMPSVPIMPSSYPIQNTAVETAP